MTTRKPYTLMEVLLVIAIICVLAGLLFPALNVARESARESAAAAGCNAIATALKQFESTYSRLPNVTIDVNSDIYTPVGGGNEQSADGYSSATAGFYTADANGYERYDRIIFALTGQLPTASTTNQAGISDAFKTANRKKMAFLEPPKDYFTNRSFFKNPWGHRYYIVYNTTGNNRMQFLRAKRGSVDTTKNVTIGSNIAVFSEVNPNSKKYKTGERLATSWGGIQDY